MLAIEGVAQAHELVIQGAGNHDDFESGSRLRGIGNHAISARVGTGGAGIVRVEGRQRRQCEDLAGARTNNDSRNAQRRVFVHSLDQCQLQAALNHRINREHQVQAVPGLDLLLTPGHHFAALAVRFGHPPAADPLEF